MDMVLYPLGVLEGSLVVDPHHRRELGDDLVASDPLSLLVYSQVLLSILIPLPMVPLLIYSSRKNLMGEFVNRRITIAVAGLIATVIIALNMFLVCSSV